MSIFYITLPHIICMSFCFRGIVQQHITQCLGHAEERISWLIALEDRPYSLNTHYYADYRSKFLAHYKGSRESDEYSDLMKTIRTSSAQISRNLPYPSSNPTGVAKALAGLAEMGMSGVKPEDLSKLFPPDKMEPALMIMADVRAYFQGTFNSHLHVPKKTKCFFFWVQLPINVLEITFL